MLQLCYIKQGIVIVSLNCNGQLNAKFDMDSQRQKSTLTRELWLLYMVDSGYGDSQ